MSKLSKTFLTDQVLDFVADSITAQGYVLLEDFLPTDLALELSIDAETLSKTKFKTAGIGRNEDKQLNNDIRTDSTLWLTKKMHPQSTYITLMEYLKQGVNQRLFLGLSDFECHFSHYRRGDFYRRHLDAFKGRSNRLLSTICYLNKNWKSNQGGELVLYANPQDLEPLSKVSPDFNRCVIFLSEVFPHEVLTSSSDRYSIAGWYSLNNNMPVYVDY
ncbi:MAG: 2OG-Fe(II) oxygenase [Paraglaciecola sp.]|uniref:2OG-Fe(II) oxygenase n=1 Tax=Paraglaciecola sp. TaxID=1920173 RepID=UPI003297846D